MTYRGTTNAILSVSRTLFGLTQCFRGAKYSYRTFSEKKGVSQAGTVVICLQRVTMINFTLQWRVEKPFPMSGRPPILPLGTLRLTLDASPEH